MDVPSRIPVARLAEANRAPVRPQGRFVLYWMTAVRRTAWNFALDRAVEWARSLDRPLVVLEALRCNYRWASDRTHRFVLDGMRDNAARLAKGPALHVPYVEPAPGAGAGLLEALAARACVVVADEFPCFFLPRMVRAAAGRLRVRLETVDGNGLLPLRAAERGFPTAYAFRRFLHRTLPGRLTEAPRARPRWSGLRHAADALVRDVMRRYPGATVLDALPIDHRVVPVDRPGGRRAARTLWRRFLSDRLARYEEERNRPESASTSGLSPYLHFGHVSVHELLHDLAAAADWDEGKLNPAACGARRGFWGMSAPAEAFLDQVVTWRELGFNCCHFRPRDYDRFASLPDWARATLEKHAADPREHRYRLAQFERARTHDELWNAAQRQLAREGVIHNYLRMLWGKKILEWSTSPRRALAIMIELNNKYALDGRDPNSYSGICWVLGRHDRPWGPERPVFGTVRYMSSANTARKCPVGGYMRRFGPARGG